MSLPITKMVFVPVCTALGQTPMRTRRVLPSVKITSLPFKDHTFHRPYHPQYCHKHNYFLEGKADANEEEVGRGEGGKKDICWALTNLIIIMMAMMMIIMAMNMKMMAMIIILMAIIMLMMIMMMLARLIRITTTTKIFHDYDDICLFKLNLYN